jgi:hypothetical protein
VEKKRVKYYQVAVVCLNCDWKGELRIPVGMLITEAECIGCGCSSLVKDKREAKDESQERSD